MFSQIWLAYRFEDISADTTEGLKSCSPIGRQVEGIIRK